MFVRKHLQGLVNPFALNQQMRLAPQSTAEPKVPQDGARTASIATVEQRVLQDRQMPTRKRDTHSLERSARSCLS